MNKRVLSMLLALVMAFSLAVPAFAADEFEAEAPAAQEEAPAAPVAEEPEAPAAEPDVPAEAAAEPETASAGEPVPAAAEGKLIIKGDTTQIYAVSMFDLDWNYAGDPREVGVVPGAEIEVWLKPGYTVEESVGGGYSWYAGEEDIPASDEDVVPAAVRAVIAPEEGGDVTITIVEGGPALPETVPVTYKNDGARFGCSPVAYKDSSRLNWVTFRPGYIVKIDGGTLEYVSPYIDGSALEAGYTVNEGAGKVTVDFIKGTGKLIIEDPEDALFKADLFDDPDEETWWNTAAWMGDVLLVNDFCPGMGINIEMSADYMLEGLDEALMMSTGVYLQDNPESDYCDELVRFYHIKTPNTGSIELKVKAAEKITVNYTGATEGIVEKDETAFPGSEFTFTLKRGYYASFENAGFNWNGVIPAEELFVNHCGVDPDAKSVTVTVTKAPGVLRFTEGRDEFMWDIGMDDEKGWYTSPIGGMKPGAHVYVALDGSASLEFVGEEPEGLNDRYEIVSDPFNDHDGKTQHVYDFTAPDHDLEIHAVKGGKIPDAITVKFEGALDAIHYDTDQVYPDGNLPLHVVPGYYVQVENGDIGFDGQVDDKGNNVFTIHAWPDAESVTVTVGKATGKLTVEGDAPVLNVWMDTDAENVRMSDPAMGLAPHAHVGVTVPNGYAVEFKGAVVGLWGPFQWISDDPNSPYFGKAILDYGCYTSESGDVTATIVPIADGATLTVQGEKDAVIPDSAQDVKDDIEMPDDWPALLSDGAAMEGIGYILVKSGYTVSAVSGAIVISYNSWVNADFTELYDGYLVIATGENPTVMVAGGESSSRVITATVINEDNADFRFADMLAEPQEDGTYKLLTFGYVDMIVEDGYELEVKGATYADSAVNEETGELMRTYILDEGAESITVTVKPGTSDIPAAPKSGTGWVKNAAGDIYFYQKGQLKKGFWVGKVDGASKWDNTWYYVGADGKLATGMHYIDDLHGGAGWYFLQPTNDNGQIGKMLTGWQWVGVQGGVNYGTCYFSAKNGESGKCTYSSELGNWNGATWEKK